MARYRLTSIRLMVLALALLAAALVALGSVMTLWSGPATASERGAARPEQPPRCTPASPCLAVVIDDVGRELSQLRRLLDSRLDLTFSVLPHGERTEQSLDALRAAGREIMLHLPMAPLDSNKITDERVVLGRDGPLEPALQACLAKVPDAVGVNNHMGSALSKDQGRVRRVLESLGGQSRSASRALQAGAGGPPPPLWFLDSRTVAGSRFCSTARQIGIRCLERDFFLDDPPHPSAVRSRLAEAVALAKRRGWAVAIGHPLRSTVDALRTLRVGSRVRVVRLSALLALAEVPQEWQPCDLTGQPTGT